MYVTSSFFHLSTNGHLGYFHSLAIINNTAVYVGVQHLFETVVYLPLDVYPVVRLVDHTLVIFLVF